VSEILFIDTETGGLDPSVHALLSIGMAHWRDGEILGTREILVQPGGRTVDSRALDINKIDLRAHNKVALARRSAAELFYRTTEEWFPSHGKNNRITLGGHNVAFDVNFIRPLFGDRWADTYNHAVVDTSSIFTFLWHSSRVPNELRGLDQGLRYFGVEVDNGKRHTALGDAVATALVYGAAVKSLASPSQEWLDGFGSYMMEGQPKKNKGTLQAARELIAMHTPMSK
jgi:DNA polymerase-3 subunit epsilon